MLKSRWISGFILLPVIVYVLFKLFETQLTLFIIPFFPDEADKSFGFYLDFLRLCFNEILWLSVFFLAVWFLWIVMPLHDIYFRVGNRLAVNSTAAVAALVLLSFFTSALIAHYTLLGFPNSADEYVYLIQSETLSRGKLVGVAHPLPDFFRFNHLALKEGVSVGRFPPGWPLILALAWELNIPPLWVNPMLGALTLLIFYHFTSRYYGRTVALWSLISMAFTGFFIFNNASFFSHTACLLFVLCFVYCVHLNLEKKTYRYALLAGAFLGMIILTRYFTAILIFLPVLVALVYRYRWQAWRPLVALGIGCIPFVAFLLWYNFSITGNAFLPVTVWVDPLEELGFVKGHTFLKGIEHLIRRSLLFLYWSSPALLILYVIFLYQKFKYKAERFIFPEDYFLLMLFVGYFFYHHPGGNQYGPRFLFEAYPFVIVFVINKVIKTRAQWSLALVMAGIIYAAIRMPYIMQREHQVVAERMDLYNRVNSMGISNAVILIASHTGVIRPMPVRDLTRNGTDMPGDIIYAQDLGDRNTELMEFYPERTFYRYIRDPEKPEGELVVLR